MAGPWGAPGRPWPWALLLLLLRLEGAAAVRKVWDRERFVSPSSGHTSARKSPSSGHTSVGSEGCQASGKSGKFYQGFHMHVHVPWTEPGLPTVNRSYGVFVPHEYDASKPTPLMMVFHGWGEGAEYHRLYDFGELSRREQFIVVYPIGMDDCNTVDCTRYTSWNGGGTTSSTGASKTCDPTVQIYDYCYDSCRAKKKGGCHPCDWTTCYDDIGFVRTVLRELQRQFCIDRTRIFAHGCSNGAMFIHDFAKQLPGIFAGVVASCGGKPHIGWEGMPVRGPPISVATIVGNRDDTIPRNGTLEGQWIWDGFYYMPERKLMQAYKRYNGCKNPARRRYGAGYNAKNMTCFEEGFHCRGGASVARCLFAGPHDFNNGTGSNSVMDDVEFAWTFLSEHPLSPEFLGPI